MFSFLSSPYRANYNSYLEATPTAESADFEKNVTSQPEVVPSEFAMLKQFEAESVPEGFRTVRNVMRFGSDKSKYKDFYFVGKLREKEVVL